MAVTRQLLIQPYTPDVTENLGDNTGQFSDQDIGKPVVYNGDQMDLAAATNEIVGFVQSVEPGTSLGHSIGSVRKQGRAKVIDEAGTLAVGDLVVAGTAVALGTLGVANVAAGAPATYKWVVLAVTGAGAGRNALVERV